MQLVSMVVNASIHDMCFSPHRKKDGMWDEYAYANFEEFKKLHADEITEPGVDNLITEEAYAKSLPKVKFLYYRD